MDPRISSITDKRTGPTDSGIVLVTTFHTNQDADTLDSVLQVAAANSGNPYLSRIVILLEGDRSELGRRVTQERLARLAEMEDAGRVRVEITNRRPSYKQMFDLANRQDATCAIIANADIVIPGATAARVVSDRRGGRQPLCALTRWNQTGSGQYLQSGPAAPPWSQVAFRDLPFHHRNLQSFDAYIVDLPLKVPDELGDIRVGAMGCDTALVGVFRVAGMAISNPCLSYQTIHVDDRPRRFSGDAAEKDTLQNVEVFRACLLSRYASDPEIRESLEKLGRLGIATAWLGGPAITDPWRAVFRALGSVPWSDDVARSQFLIKRIPVKRSEIEKSRLQLNNLVDELANGCVFIEWELSGFEEDENIVNILARYPAYRDIAGRLGRYQWQSMIHVDRATPEMGSIHRHLLMVIKELLVNGTNAVP